MSINDPLILRYNERHDYYFLTRGRETFYDPKSRHLRIWEDPRDAILWAEEALDESPITEEINLCEFEGKPK